MATLAERTGVPVPRPGRFAAMVVVANPAIREAVAHTLRALGARHVLEVGSVTEARARAGAGIADLCVVEAGLPDGSGIALLRELRDRMRDEQLIGPGELSMGMSGDFELAIEEGSTCVRVGQAIFGSRATPDSAYWPGEG